MNYGDMKRLWRDAWNNSEITEYFGTVTPKATGRSEKIAIPNMSKDAIAIVLHGSISITATAAEAFITTATPFSVLDNIVLTDGSGKTVLDISHESAYSYSAEFVDEVPAYTALTDFAGVATHVTPFVLVIPVFIPAGEGIHHLQFDYALTNCYLTDVGLDAASLIDLEVVCSDYSGLSKWKAIDQGITYPVGNYQVTTLEGDRVWYALGILGGLAATTDIDDVVLKTANLSLLDSEYTKIAATWAKRAGYTPRAATDAFLPFMEHYHAHTDYLKLEGAVTKTITVLLIASTVEGRPAATQEISQPYINRPVVTSTQGAVTSGGVGVRGVATVGGAGSTGGARLQPVQPKPIVMT